MTTFIFCKCKDEPLYRYLADKSKGLIEVFENLEKLPALNDLNACKQTLIIFEAWLRILGSILLSLNIL